MPGKKYVASFLKIVYTKLGYKIIEVEGDPSAGMPKDFLLQISDGKMAKV